MYYSFWLTLIHRTALETDLRIERDWRISLQKNIEQEKYKIGQLQSEIQQLKQVKSDYESLHKKHRELQVMFEEQEKALAELGSHLSV